MRLHTSATGVLAAAFALLALAGAPAQAAPRTCDRACMEGLVGQYLAALAAHDPSKLPAARTIRFVENDQPLRLGEGTWATVDGLGAYRHIFADPEGGAVAAITTVKENGVPAILDVVLKVEDRRITGVETQIVRDAAGAGRYETLGAPEPLWLQPVAPADRIPREALAGTPNKYFQGMQRNDPKGDYSFFDPDCNRLEHAQQTTNLKTPEAYGHSSDTDFSSMGCEAQFKTGFLGFVTNIRDRRYLVVDEERQAVFAFADFDHNGTVRVLHMSTGKDFVVPAYFDVPRTLQVGEAFRMRGARIHRIEMTLTELPYGMKPAGQPPEDPPPRLTPGKAPCDRDCLAGVADQVIQAMIDHAPGEAPLAPGARYTENGQRLEPGDGLWGTASAIALQGDGLATLGPGIAAYKLYFADPATGEAGFLGAVNENGTPGMLALRVKVVAGKASEIEAFIVRQETTGARGGTMTLMRPLILAEFDPKGFTDPDPVLLNGREKGPRSSLTGAVDHYWEALERGPGAGAAFTSDCLRRDNGRQTTSNAAAGPIDPATPDFKPFALGCQAQIQGGAFGYVSKVRGRRDLVVDEDRGLVLALAMIDHTGAVKTLAAAPGKPALPSNLLTPSTDMTLALFKVQNGRIVRIEALERPVPFGMTTGWGE